MCGNYMIFMDVIKCFNLTPNVIIQGHVILSLHGFFDMLVFIQVFFLNIYDFIPVILYNTVIYKQLI